MKTKVCSKCKEEKSLSDFYKDSDKKSNLRPDCKICRDKITLKYYTKNKKDISKQVKKNYIKNRKLYRLKHKDYYLNNKQQIQSRIIKNRKENREGYNKQKNNRYHNDINFKVMCCLRTRIYQALKGENKSLSTMILIGCEIDYLMFHIQEQFTEGMNWNNYGSWHIDHKLPCTSFDLSKSKEQQKCFHYSNLQPLWAIDNIRKGNKYYAK